MKSESLDKALDAFLQTLDRLDIDRIDKVELMLNLKSFLSIMSYEHNIEVLEKERLRMKEESYGTSQCVQVPKRK